jgi:hypothetical protein
MRDFREPVLAGWRDLQELLMVCSFMLYEKLNSNITA